MSKSKLFQISKTPDTKYKAMKSKKLHNLLFVTILAVFFIQSIVLFFLFIAPINYASAQEKSTATAIKDAITGGGVTFTPQVSIPGGSEFDYDQCKENKCDGVDSDECRQTCAIELNKSNRGLLIANYIQAWYKFAVAGVGILAVVMIMGGGLFWLTAGGKADQVSTAKDWINGAIVGLILALMSYTLLDILNPNLVTFQSLNINSVDLVEMEGPTLKRCEDIKCSDGMICIIKSDGYPACIKDEYHWECSSSFNCKDSPTTVPYGAFYCDESKKLSCGAGEDLICCKNE